MYKVATWCIIAVIVGLCNASADFLKAAAFVRSSKPMKTSDENKLKVYALYKQATTGDAPKSGQGEIDPYARLTLNAWFKLKGMKQEVAESEYVKIIDQLSPGWR